LRAEEDFLTGPPALADQGRMFDFTVLGGGSAGYAAARTANDLGLKTAVIDGSETLGGLCILRGCMPSKTLIESANRNRTLKRASEFGLRASGLEVRGEEVIARKRRLIGEFADYRREQLESGKFELIRGFGRFLDANRVEVSLRDGGKVVVESKTWLIATGSEIFSPKVPGLEEAGFLTSDDILDLETIPESIVVLGGGPIALEMAHYLEGVGSRVTVIQRSAHTLKSMDSDLAEVVEEASRERGIDVFCGTSLSRVEPGKTVVFEQDGTEKSVTASEILLALGRKPATGSLDLAAAGVETDRGRVRAESTQQTTAPNIFAAGDVCGPLEVVHLAIEQGEAAAHNAAIQLGVVDSPEKRMDYRLKLFGVFTEPQVAMVGDTEAELKAAGRRFNVAKYPFDDHGKSMVMGETHGFVKLIADATTGELLGGSVVGPEAVDLIHEIVVAMHFHSTAAQLATIPHYHPTLSEIWTYPAEELAETIEN
jgi:pyruvate/2-oxoglutarate dehydrogenase complex dihydrolipoamide dehydrogenase (E3) component